MMFKFFILLLLSKVETRRNNICKEFADYNFRDSSPNCWYNPDAKAPAEEIITRHGYKAEIHQTVTEDFFVLTVFRVAPKSKNVKGIVFLQHPALSSATVWLAAGNESFAFLLSNAGYDVWLGNFRATSYSEKNLRLSKGSNQNKYWNYSFHEFGVYDAPAQIELVRNRTGYRQKLIYIGHSVGTTAAFIYASLKPAEAARNVEIFISWSPIANLGHAKSPAVALAPFSNQILELTQTLQLPGGISFDGLSHYFLEGYCLGTPSHLQECSNLIDLGVGPSNKQGNPETLPLLIYQCVEGFSIKTLAHFGQVAAAGGRFQWYDYGPTLNRVYYRSRYPPAYPLDKIRVPVRLVYGSNDYCATEQDVYILYEKLPKDVRMGVQKVEGLNHFDFHYGKELKELVHVPTIKFLNAYVKR